MTTKEVPSHLHLVSLLTASTTIVTSTVYIILSILGLVYRYECDLGSTDSTASSGFFLNVLFRVYIQNEDCDSSIKYDDLTASYSVFVLNIITLCASALALLAAVVLITVLLSKEHVQRLYLAAIGYVCLYFASLVVDLTCGIHFGIDYSTLSERMNAFDPGMTANYQLDMARLSALLLMVIALKGFVIHIFNLVLITLLLIYLVDYQNQLKRHEHSIHKLGAINGFDQSRRQQDSWNQDPQVFMGLNNRGPQVNPAFIDDGSTISRTPMREPNMSDYSRSESWQAAPTRNHRPFSYLEEPRRPIPVKSPNSPSIDPNWRKERDWPPPVPAPDYSPPGNRRLKSALKPSYM